MSKYLFKLWFIYYSLGTNVQVALQILITSKQYTDDNITIIVPIYLVILMKWGYIDRGENK